MLIICILIGYLLWLTIFSLGFCLHYITRGVQVSIYEQDLVKIEPYLRKLSKLSTVVWLVQDNVRDYAQRNKNDNTNVYNSVAKRILK